MIGWLAKKRLQRQLLEKQPLPTGRKEFEAWAKRIIQKADVIATEESQKYTLANVLVNSCGPAVAFESDAYFITYLRKSAANQVAITIRDEIYAKKQARLEAEKQSQAAASANPVTSHAEVLALPGIQKA